jgi:hypothetical protein
VLVRIVVGLHNTETSNNDKFEENSGDLELLNRNRPFPASDPAIHNAYI